MTQHQEYPKWLPTPDGKGVVVFNEQEEKDHGLQKQGQEAPEAVESLPDFLNPDAPKRRGRPRKE